MSERFLPDSFKEQETKPPRTPEQGPESYLSPEERRFWKRFTSFPEELHPDFLSWIIDYLKTNLPSEIRIDQFAGFRQFTAVHSAIATSEATTSASYVDLATVGPQIAGLADGQYVLHFGCQVIKGAVNDGGAMGLSFNGAAVAAEDAPVFLSDTSAVAQNTTVSRSLLKRLSGGDNNSITAQFKTTNGNSISFANRYITALRVGN